MASRDAPMTLLLVLLASCGRFGFGSHGDDNPVPMDGTAGTDGSDATPDRPNVAFITGANYAGALGGLAGADSICQTAAMSQSLPGTFVALLSTSTSNAIDRLAGSRGWVRTDGEPLVDKPTDLITGGRMFNLLNVDEGKVRLPFNTVTAWTASTTMGVYDPASGACSDWTTQTGTGGIGFYDRTAPLELKNGPANCTALSHLYCFETGHVAVVGPHAVAGNVAFVSQKTSQSVATFDAKCASDAAAAGLPAGTYLAGVATQSTTIQSRFTTSTGPYRRPDGTLVSTDATLLFAGTSLSAPMNQYADGTYISTGFALSVTTGTTAPQAVGTMVSTCNDWTAASGNGEAGTAMDARSSEAWGGASMNCGSSTLNVYCFQQ